MIYALAGKHGSGKNYLLNKLSTEPNLKLVVPYTDRPQRKGEIDGKDNHFATKHQMERMIKSKQLICIQQFPTNGDMHYYGIPKSDLQSSKDIILQLSPLAINQLKSEINDVRVILIYASPVVRKDRYLKRGGVYTELEFDSREARDMEQFNQLKYDRFIMNNEINNHALSDIKKYIKEVRM